MLAKMYASPSQHEVVGCLAVKIQRHYGLDASSESPLSRTHSLRQPREHRTPSNGVYPHAALCG